MRGQLGIFKLELGLDAALERVAQGHGLRVADGLRRSHDEHVAGVLDIRRHLRLRAHVFGPLDVVAVGAGDLGGLAVAQPPSLHGVEPEPAIAAILASPAADVGDADHCGVAVDELEHGLVGVGDYLRVHLARSVATMTEPVADLELEPTAPALFLVAGDALAPPCVHRLQTKQVVRLRAEHGAA